MKFNTEFVVGIAYVAIMVGMAWGQVGEMSGPAEPFSWWLPIIIAIVCGFPFLLGFLAGKNSR